ncbi:MAG: phosphatase PAP2 family protein [Syntrophus sp. (in: bacteria)]
MMVDALKNIRLLLLLALVLSLGACTPAVVKQTLAGTRGVYYLDSTAGQFPMFPAPPLPGSATDQADLKVLQAWQAKRTAAECTRAHAEARGNFESLFENVSPFSRPLPPEVAAFFKHVHTDLDYAVGTVKERYQRPRPFFRGLGFKPCIYLISGYAYPSGHAANARLFALILSDLSPDRRAEFMARADEAALDRVIGGVHYPTDIEAGKRLGEAIYVELRKNPTFQRDEKALEKYIVKKDSR